ncbi:MAG TPA: elongation factor G [Acidimicrobiales bacterium]|nr:elongation factor G [Acidimicrobiales bacterium]
MERYATDRIRNVALVGHGGAGKTSLTEALLHRAGASPRLGRVEDGTTTSDFTPEERKRGLSLSLAVAPFTWRDHKVNLLDTPGYADFLGDVAAALRVADLAVFVVSAVDGVEPQTEVAWRMAADLRLPRLVFVNKLDRERANYEATLAQLRDRLGPGIAPLELPLGEEAVFRGIADLLTDTAHVYVDGVPHTEPIPDDMEEDEKAVHDTLVEGIVVGDDGLLERYLDGEELSLEELERALHDGIAAANVFPVVVGSATREVGIDRLADFLVEIGPSPLDRVTTVNAGDTEVDVAADPDGQPLAFVFKTVLDPYVGQVSLFRVLSGTIHADDHLVNSRTGSDERLHGLLTVRGREQQPVTEVVAGDIAAVAKLGGTTTGDTLAPRGTPVTVPPIEQPEPVLAVAVTAATQGDEDKLASALHRLVDEDPALRVDRVDETHQTLLRGTGETHLQVTLEKLTRRFGCQVTTDDVRVPYRETITGSATRVEGRHKKQTGGHGQFAVAVVNVEPLPAGGGFEFVDKIVGGAISRGYIPAVQKGIEEAMASGGAFGYPVVDVRVTLTDGKEHPVDSSEMAFKVAGRLAFRAALAQANPVVLEPVSRLEITVPLALQGEVLGDLNSRRGRVLGTEVGEVPGEQVLVASVPTAEVQRYAVDLRSLTGGRGRFRHRHDHYAPLPAHLVDAVRREVSEVG